MKNRIKLEMSTLDALVAMSEGNPGALTALMEMVEKGPRIDPDCACAILPILQLDQHGIYGSRLYMLWNDVCGRSIAYMLAVLRAYQLGQLAGCTESAINHAIDNRGAGIDNEAVMDALRVALPKFNSQSSDTQAVSTESAES